MQRRLLSAMADVIIHTESSTSISFRKPKDFHDTKSVFLNPVQQYNRDLSVLAIRSWSELCEEERNVKASESFNKRQQKLLDKGHIKEKAVFDASLAPRWGFRCLEALSASGLRAIRYAQEIPLLDAVVANDLSEEAVEDIQENIKLNAEKNADVKTKVTVNQGDARSLMYGNKENYDCIDLDPYGSAVPFLDAAVQSITDNGLLCVTCTDAGVLAGRNYPEKSFTHYGGVCTRAEYSHEVAIRLILHSIATAAAKYGRYIEPLLSLSVDFYFRVFVRVGTGALKVKDLPVQTGLVYYCLNCEDPHIQPMGRRTLNAKTTNKNYNYHIPAGPPKTMTGTHCSQCEAPFHLSGPMWIGPLHNSDFVKRMLDTLDKKFEKDHFSTHARMEGMLSTVQTELATEDSLFYFTPSVIARLFNANTPSLLVMASALLNAGYKVSRTHAAAASIKTDAPRAFVLDVLREYIKEFPVNINNIKKESYRTKLLAKPQTHTVNLTIHEDAKKHLLLDQNLLKFQVNPQKNWGPQKAAIKGDGKKKSAKKTAGENGISDQHEKKPDEKTADDVEGGDANKSDTTTVEKEADQDPKKTDKRTLDENEDDQESKKPKTGEV